MNKRAEKLYKLYTQKGRTLTEIGDMEGVSRQRIHQILASHPDWTKTEKHTKKRVLDR